MKGSVRKRGKTWSYRIDLGKTSDQKTQIEKGEIGTYMNAAPNVVTSWVSKARKFLRKRPEMRAYRPMGFGL